MPGNPMYHKLAADIKDLGGDEHIFGRIEDGEPIGKIAKSFGVSRALLYKWRDRDAERIRGWEQAVKGSADARVEQASEILDECEPENPSVVALARARSDDRKWLASKLNREKYGEASGPAVTINVGSLHLDALRQMGALRPMVEVPQLTSGED
jgi:transposase-like protein